MHSSVRFVCIIHCKGTTKNFYFTLAYTYTEIRYLKSLLKSYYIKFYYIQIVFLENYFKVLPKDYFKPTSASNKL